MIDNNQNIELLEREVFNSNTPLERLHQIFVIANTFEDEFDKARVFAGIAQNPNTPLAGLNEIYNIAVKFNNEGNEASVLQGIARNPKANKEILNKIFNIAVKFNNENNKDFVFRALINDDCSLNILAIIAGISNNQNILNQIFDVADTLNNANNKAFVFESIARNPKANKEILNQIYNIAGNFENANNKAFVFAGIRNNPNTPLEILNEIDNIANNFEDEEIVGIVGNRGAPHLEAEFDQVRVFEDITTNHNTSLSAEELQTLLRRLYGPVNGEAVFTLEDEQRYLAHAILQSILFSMEQHCEITFEVTENCINDGFSTVPMNIRALNEYIQNKPEQTNPFSNTKIQPETLYFMRCNGYNNVITDNNFNTYKRIYINALTAIARDNLDVFSLLPQEIQEAVEEYKSVLSFMNLVFKALINNHHFSSGILRSIATNPNTILERLNEIFNIAKDFQNEEHKAIIFEGIAQNPNTPLEILNDMFEIANTFQNEKNKSKVFVSIALNSNTPLERLNDMFEIAGNFEDEVNKSRVFKALINSRHCTVGILRNIAKIYNDRQILNEIYNRANDLPNEQYKFCVFKALINNPNITEEIFQQISDNVQTINDLRYKTKLLEEIEKHPMNNLQVAVPNTFANMIQNQNGVDGQGINM